MEIPISIFGFADTNSLYLVSIDLKKSKTPTTMKSIPKY